MKTKQYGEEREATTCGRCNNIIKRVYLRDKTYATIFFIPAIPYKTEYFLVCPICSCAEQFTAQQFQSITGER